MKKFISSIAILTLTSSAALPLTACSADDALKIAFVPSKDAVDIMNIVGPLEGLLKNKIHELYPAFNKNVKISTTTNYQAAGQALKDGKTALAFLPIGTYSDYRGDEITTTDGAGNYVDAGPLVVAQRDPMIPDINTGIREREITPTQQITVVEEYNKITFAPITGKEDAYNKLYSKDSEEKTSFYRSEVIINNQFLKQEKDKGLEFDNPETYKENIQQLIVDAKVKNNGIALIDSSTSSAGVIYPVKWMLDNGVSESIVTDILQNQSRVSSYTEAIERVRNNSASITFAYADARVDSGNDQDITNNFANTTMIGLTSGILNDGISYSKKVVKDDALLAAIREAFKILIEDPNNAEIFGVYSHTGYNTPGVDATPEEVLAWEKGYNDEINDANQAVQSAIDLVKASIK